MKTAMDAIRLAESFNSDQVIAVPIAQTDWFVAIKPEQEHVLASFPKQDLLASIPGIDLEVEQQGNRRP